MTTPVTRRDWLTTLGAGLAVTSLAPTEAHAEDRPSGEPFGYCLNTSTISGQKLTLVDEVGIAAKAGYQALEPWIRELDEHVKSGGSLKELGRRISDAGLTVESAIGFFEWAVDDDGRRRKALEEAKRNMDSVKQIGGKRIAAPPVGATDRSDIDLHRIAERYRALLELGDQMGVVPQAVWGFSKRLAGSATRLVAIESGHVPACILPDAYQFMGGSNSRRAPAQRQRDARLPLQRLPGIATAIRDQRRSARLSRRWSRAFEAVDSRPPGYRVSWRPLARTVQPRLLEARRANRGQHRPGENASRRPERSRRLNSISGSVTYTRCFRQREFLLCCSSGGTWVVACPVGFLNARYHSIDQIEFVGLIGNRLLTEVTTNESHERPREKRLG